jgi:hypothetical protein
VAVADAIGKALQLVGLKTVRGDLFKLALDCVMSAGIALAILA